jgi:hypothetical protein
MPLFYHILSIPAKLFTGLNASPPSASGIWGDALCRCPILQTPHDRTSTG